MQELVQSRKRELGLQFDANGGQDATAPSPDSRTGSPKERRLAHTRFAADDQRSATNVNLIDNRVEDLRLGLAPDQVGNVIDRERGGHRLRIGLFLGSPE
jgi:hypothetical protein